MIWQESVYGNLKRLLNLSFRHLYIDLKSSFAVNECAVPLTVRCQTGGSTREIPDVSVITGGWEDATGDSQTVLITLIISNQRTTPPVSIELLQGS